MSASVSHNLNRQDDVPSCLPNCSRRGHIPHVRGRKPGLLAILGQPRQQRLVRRRHRLGHPTGVATQQVLRRHVHARRLEVAPDPGNVARRKAPHGEARVPELLDALLGAGPEVQLGPLAHEPVDVLVGAKLPGLLDARVQQHPVEQRAKQLEEGLVPPRERQVRVLALGGLDPAIAQQLGLDARGFEFVAQALVQGLEEAVVGDQGADHVEDDVLGGFDGHDGYLGMCMIMEDSK